MEKRIVYALRQLFFINTDAARAITLWVKVNDEHLASLFSECCS